MVKKLSGQIWRIVLPVIAVLFLCVAPIFVAGPAGYLPIIAVIIALLICLVYLLILRSAIRCIDVTQAHSCQRGEGLDFTLRMENHSFLVSPQIEAAFYLSDLFGDVDTEMAFTFTQAPFEKRDFPLDVRFDHIGRYTAGLKKVKIYGLLGILSFTLDKGSVYNIEVLPNVWDIEQLDVSEMIQLENPFSKIAAQVEGGDYSDIREYVAGDSIKSIHWKLSAHTNTYMTKRMETYGNPGMTVVLDLCCGTCDSESKMKMFDAVVEAAMSICYFALRNGLENDLHFIDRDDNDIAYSAVNIDEYRNAVWDMPPITDDRKRYDVELLLSRAGRDLYAKNNLALCTACMTDEIIQRLIEVKQSRRNPILIYILPGGLSDQELEDYKIPLRALDSYGITCLTINSANQL